MSGLFVACLCAQWCGTCREYQPGFEALNARFPDIEFAWIDIEDESDVVGDLDVENFPSIVIQRGGDVLFYGPMLPQLPLLERLITTFAEQSAEEAHAYAHANADRRAWQEVADVRSRMR